MSQLLLELRQLQELLSNYEGYSLLLERLGTLRQINLDLLKGLKDSVDRYDHSKPSEYGLKARKTKTLVPKLGQGSTIITGENIRTTAQIIDKFADTDRIAVVIKVGDDQVLLIADMNRVHGKTDKGATLMIATPKLYDILPKADYLKAIDPSTKNAHKYQQLVTTGVQDTWVKVRTLLSNLLGQAKEKKLDVDVMFITQDKEQAKIHAKREATRQGMIPLPKDPRQLYGKGRYSRTEGVYKKFLDDMRHTLKSRLDKYKGSKSEKFDTPEELIKGLIDKGYFDKLKFRGKVYNLSNDQIRLSSLKGKDHGSSSYIEYEREGGYFDAEYYEERTKLSKELKDKQAKAEMSEKDAEKWYEDAMESLMQKFPPRNIKVMLGFEGGKIVPKELVFSS